MKIFKVMFLLKQNKNPKQNQQQIPSKPTKEGRRLKLSDEKSTA